MMTSWVPRAVIATLATLLTLGALAASCAPRTQQPLRPPAAFAGPELDGEWFVSFDGARLGLSIWEPGAHGWSDEPWAAIVALHGMSEHSDAFWLAGPYWASQGVAVYAYDQRGFGRSPQRGVWPGGALMRRDLAAALDVVRARHPNAVLAVVGQSMGGAVALSADAAASAPLADRVIATAPAVRRTPFIQRVPLWFASRLGGPTAVEPPKRIVRRIQASDNIEALRRNGRDPLYLHDTRFDTLAGLVALMDEAAVARAGRQSPLLVLHGDNDELVARAAVERAVARLGPCARTGTYADGWHMLLRDLQAETVWRDIVAFLRDPAAPAPSGAPPLARAPATDWSLCPG